MYQVLHCTRLCVPPQKKKKKKRVRWANLVSTEEGEERANIRLFCSISPIYIIYVYIYIYRSIYIYIVRLPDSKQFSKLTYYRLVTVHI